MDSNETKAKQARIAREAVKDSIVAVTAELAFVTWVDSRLSDEDTSRALFNRLYIGHYSNLDYYTDQIIDKYQLDSRLDAAIEAPFRRHVDIDVASLSRALIRDGVVTMLLAQPIGVWIFHAEA